QNQQFSMFENKAAVELAKGPTSVRYGFTTPGGVINYVLKRPTEEDYRWIQAFGDSNGAGGVHLDFGGTSGTLGYRVNAVIAEDALFIDDIDGPRRGFSALFEWKPIENLTIDLDLEYNDRDVRAPTRMRLSSFADDVSLERRQAIVDRFDPTTNIGQDYSSRPEDYTILSLGGSYEFNRDWAVQGRVTRMQGGYTTQVTSIARGSLQANGDFTVTQSFSPEPRNPTSFEAFVIGRFDTLDIQHDVSFGVATSRNPLELSLNRTRVTLGQNNIFNPVDLPAGNPTSGPPSEILIFNQRAVFASDLITVNEKFRVFGALRWAEQENEDDFNPERIVETSYEDDAISYNAGVMFDPIENLTQYASRSEGITPGNQIPTDAANSGFNGDGNAFLDPAETEQFEVGLKYDLRGRALLTAAYFDITQPQAAFDENNFFGYIGDQQHQGFEITASGSITDDVRVIAGALFLDAALSNPENPSVDGNRPVNVPETQFNLYIDYEPPFLRGVGLNAGLYYTGDRFADNNETFEVDAYTRLDLGARYHVSVGDQQLTARLNIRNVTDEEFLEAVAFGFFDYGAPLTAVFSLSTEF
ncbi:MAG: TonB-dependent siderophore receptor, partial [Pseudomonadota bacterium]